MLHLFLLPNPASTGGILRIKPQPWINACVIHLPLSKVLENCSGSACSIPSSSSVAPGTVPTDGTDVTLEVRVSETDFDADNEYIEYIDVPDATGQAVTRIGHGDNRLTQPSQAGQCGGTYGKRAYGPRRVNQ